MFQSVPLSSPFSLLSQRLKRMATLIGCTFRSVTLQSEAGS
jgi:hypothetical protein